MNDNWVVQQIRKVCLRRLIWWGGVLACLLLFVLSQHRYIANFFQGPFTLGKAELDSIQDASSTPRYFARVSGSKAIDTGIRQITVRKRAGVETSRSVSGEFYVLMLEDRLLVVKGSSGPQQLTAEGELLPMRRELEAKLFNTPDMQAIKKRFYPFYIEDGSFRLPGYIAGAVIAVIGFFAVWLGAAPLKQYLAPSTHPLAQKVASWGDPARVAAQIEQQSRAPRYKSVPWQITDQYLIQSAFFAFDLHRLTDLQWAYKRVTSSGTAKGYNAVLVMNGGSADVRGSEKDIDAVLDLAAERAPWAVFGYSKEIEEQFNKNRQGFAATIEQRRRDWAQQAGAAR
ncbi:MAG TPA: DUF6709 family protein [Burkholderiales bacterium]|jgi:hypothetical protein|nr:DUF6709 family protein [Burkholderiales bacterium]